MFTGIIETTGLVRSLQRSQAGARLAIDAGRVAERPALGASVAVNGVCQTVAADRFPILEFDVIPETLRRTTIGRLKPGDTVNLERSLRAGDRLEGHIVQGHVDGIAFVTDVVRDGAEWVLRLRLEDPSLSDFVVPKGSVAIDGVSLTVAECPSNDPRQFGVALIPTTLELTTLGQRRPGDAVNVETDILTRTVVTWLRRIAARPDRPITPEFLREYGFA